MSLQQAVKDTMKAFLGSEKDEHANQRIKDLPLKGFQENQVFSGQLENFSDEALAELNNLLNWHCFTVDSQGRRIGNVAWEGKRHSAEAIPHSRIKWLNEKFDLSSKSVIEFGCFEGAHTLGLRQFCKQVCALDSRVENVVKTIVRTQLMGYPTDVRLFNLETDDISQLPKADILHHVGVLYHLKDPVAHLQNIQHYIGQTILLDTHYCLTEEATESYIVASKEYAYKRYGEKGYQDPFSGMYDHAKWLKLDDIVSLLVESGFTFVKEIPELVKPGSCRNGPRTTLVASKISF